MKPGVRWRIWFLKDKHWFRDGVRGMRIRGATDGWLRLPWVEAGGVFNRGSHVLRCIPFLWRGTGENSWFFQRGAHVLSCVPFLWRGSARTGSAAHRRPFAAKRRYGFSIRLSGSPEMSTRASESAVADSLGSVQGMMDA